MGESQNRLYILNDFLHDLALIAAAEEACHHIAVGEAYRHAAVAFFIDGDAKGHIDCHEFPLVGTEHLRGEFCVTEVYDLYFSGIAAAVFDDLGLLIDHARRRRAQKRGGGAGDLPLDENSAGNAGAAVKGGERP